MNLESLNLDELNQHELKAINAGDDVASKSGWWYVSYAIGYIVADMKHNGLGGVKDSNGWGSHGP
jgi:hypothetical protein